MDTDSDSRKMNKNPEDQCLKAFIGHISVLTLFAYTKYNCVLAGLSFVQNLDRDKFRLHLTMIVFVSFFFLN